MPKITTLECLFLTDPCLKRVPSLTSVGLDWGWNGKKMSAWMDSHFGPWVIHCIIYNPLLGSFRGHPPCVHLYHPDRISGGVIPKKYPLHSGLNPALQSYFCYLLLLSFSSKPFMCSIWSTLIHSTHLVVFLATANDFVTITVIIREATASQQMICQRCVTL